MARKAGRERGAEIRIEDWAARETREARRPMRETMTGEATTPGESGESGETAREIKEPGRSMDKIRRPMRETMAGEAKVPGEPEKREIET